MVCSALALVGGMLWASSAPVAEAVDLPAVESLWAHSVFPIGVEERGRFVALGTAFVAGPKGAVVTHLSAVAGAREVAVKLPDGNLLTADTAVAVDPRAQLAVLAITPVGVSPLKLGSAERLSAGREVTVVGAPHVLDHVIDSNRVSRITFLGGGRKRIEVEHPLQPGALGAPVLGPGDRVMGVASFGSSDGAAVHSVIAVEELKRLLRKSAQVALRSIKQAPARGFVRPRALGERDAQLRPPSRVLTTKMHNAGITHFNLSLALTEKGMTDAALQQIKGALQANPYLPDAQNNLGMLLAKGGDHKGALRAYGAATAMAPSKVDYCSNLALTYCHVGRYDDAEVVAGRCLARDAKHARSRAILGMALVGQGKGTDTAIEHLRAALAREPGLTWALGVLATALARSGQLDEAIDYGRKAVEASPTNARVQGNLAELYAAKHLWKEAISSYEQAIALQPDNPESRERLGDLLVEAGRAGEALKAYEGALRMDRDNAELSTKAEALRKGADPARGAAVGGAP